MMSRFAFIVTMHPAEIKRSTSLMSFIADFFSDIPKLFSYPISEASLRRFARRLLCAGIPLGSELERNSGVYGAFRAGARINSGAERTGIMIETELVLPILV